MIKLHKFMIHVGVFMKIKPFGYENKIIYHFILLLFFIIQACI